jgi:hypothetical protein
VRLDDVGPFSTKAPEQSNRYERALWPACAKIDDRASKSLKLITPRTRLIVENAKAQVNLGEVVVARKTEKRAE